MHYECIILIRPYIILIRLEDYTVEVTVGGKIYELALWDTGGIYWALLASYMSDFFLYTWKIMIDLDLYLILIQWVVLFYDSQLIT